MKPRAVIHLLGGEKIKTAETIGNLIMNLDRLQSGGTLHVNRLTDHGSVKSVYVAGPTVTRLEEL